MHQAQWSPERPLPPPVSLASQSHHEKPPEVTCTCRGNPGFPASTASKFQRKLSLSNVTAYLPSTLLRLSFLNLQPENELPYSVLLRV